MSGAFATYRLQLTGDFGFAQAAATVPYLANLGITHLYASPFMRARAGSTHGYDVVDHAAFNPELGGEAGFEVLSKALEAHGLGLILDFVPNHMGVHFSDNAWWLDVLEWGPKSRYAKSFDIDWDLLPHRRKPGVLLPILGTSYGEALERGDIVLRYDRATGFSCHYFEHRLPVSPRRYSDILRIVVSSAGAGDTSAGKALLALAKASTGPHVPDQAGAEQLKRDIADVGGGERIIGKGLSAYRAEDGAAQTLALHHLLERQHYRLSHWKLASSDINYRRFFDVNSLAGLRIEDFDTFERVHALVRNLIATDKIQGLRIDHIDGLFDPTQYLQRLRRLIRDAQVSPRPFLLLIEKIVGENESLAPLSDSDGTTGYECLNQFSQLLLAPKGHAELKEIWRQASNLSPAFEPVLIDAKRRVLETLLVSEFTVLTRLLARIAAGHYTTRDYSEDSLRQALALYVLHFPVYRTYIRGRSVNARDRATIDDTITRAKAEWFAADDGIFDFLKSVLTLDLVADGKTLHSRARVRRFASKIQQFTGPLMAKSLEDTAFYRYPLLLALNEVGGNPAADPLSPREFHRLMHDRAGHWPRAMTSTATHDTKRGEDARMRILAISEIAGDWSHAVGRWKTQNARWVTMQAGDRCPSIVDEYMIYQAVIGAVPMTGITPDFVDRFQQYVQKAVREEKLHSSWLNPNAAYEDGIRAFVAGILDPQNAPEFLASFSVFARRTALLGALNSLSQLTLKATVPGIPDFYQGTELWDLSLVDPDNRRAVDFTHRAQILATQSSLPGASWENGHIKLSWTRKLLEFRHAHADIFSRGDYRELSIHGPHADHVIAFARQYRNNSCYTVALRNFGPLTDGGMHWPDFRSIEARIDDRGRSIDIGRILRDVPAAVLSDTSAPVSISQPAARSSV